MFIKLEQHKRKTEHFEQLEQAIQVVRYNNRQRKLQNNKFYKAVTKPRTFQLLRTKQ